jgi:hypothetical protein
LRCTDSTPRRHSKSPDERKADVEFKFCRGILKEIIEEPQDRGKLRRHFRFRFTAWRKAQQKSESSSANCKRSEGVDGGGKAVFTCEGCGRRF